MYDDIICIVIMYNKCAGQKQELQGSPGKNLSLW